jgi:GGDEF domain-containing protein
MTLNNFALVYIDLYNLDSIKDKIGKDASLVLATQFFSNINNDVKDLKVYEIGYYKYAFIIRSEETYNNILRDLNNNTSTLLKANLNFNDLSFEIRSYLGFVERNNVSDPTTELMMNLAEESLKLASNKDYSKDYSIYFSKKKQIEEEVKNIDLSDDFLDKILK